MPEFVDAVEDVLDRVIEIGRSTAESQADLPSDCPGWSVRDLFAHIVGLGQLLEGAPVPQVDLPDLDHVESDLDRHMEGPVHIRRHLPLVAIVDELAGFKPRRLAHLRDLANSDGDPEVIPPFGDPRALSAVLPVHLVDIWSHEQDIRRALGIDIQTDTPAGLFCLSRTLEVWAALLPRKVEGLGAELVVTVAGREPEARSITIELGEGGQPLGLSGSAASLTRAGFGRGPLEARLADLTLDGPENSFDAIVPHLVFTP